MPKVGEIGDCPLCFGRLLPLSACQSCNTVVAREGLDEVGPTIVCEDCGATNPTHFVCSACSARFPFGDIVKPEGPTCPVCHNPVPAEAALCPHCSAVLPVAGVSGARARRRIRGEYTDDDVNEVGRIPGVGRAKAEALCAGGYNALWKVQRAPGADLTRVRGIGAKGAAAIKDSLRFLLLVGRKKSKEEVLSEENECPLCGTVTSLFADRCHGCGALFDEEELDEDFRTEVGQEPEKGLLAYYDVRLLEHPASVPLHYARAILLLSIGRPAEALAGLDKVLELRPGDPQALQAKARALAGAKGMGSAAQVLREVVKAAQPGGVGEQPEPPARDEEAAIEALAGLGEAELECPECGEKQVAGTKACPVCGHRFAPEERTAPGPEESLLEDLERAVAGEARAPPPPLRPEVPEVVVDKKRSMLTFLLKIPGVSRRAAESVSGFFQDLEQIGMSDAADVADIPGVAPAEARLIKEAVDRSLGPVETAPPSVPTPAPAAVPTPPRPAPRPRVRDREVPSVPKPLPTPRPAAPGPVPAAPRARSMEITAGRRGLINGRGLVNGRGRVNGLINGSGFVNGSSVSEPRIPRKNLTPRYVAIGAALLMVFGAAALLVGPEERRTAIVIDGSFGDWSGVMSYDDRTTATNASAQITSVSARVDVDHLFIRIGVAGALFGSASGYNTLYAFIDTDPAGPLGYDLTDMRPDFLVRVSGAGGRVEDARLMSYAATANGSQDWTGWGTMHGLTAMAGDYGSSGGVNAVEVDAPVDSLGASFSQSTFRLRAVADDNGGSSSHTIVPVQPGSPGLVVRQSAASNTVTTVQTFLQVELRATGGPVTVDSLGVAAQNATLGPPSPAGPWTVGVQPATLVTYEVDPGGAPQGAVIDAQVTTVSTSAPFSIVGGPVRAYRTLVPTGKRIDGLFLDWPNPKPDSDAKAVRRASLDIVLWNGSLTGTDVYMYAKLNGSVLEGGWIPVRLLRPGPGGGGGGSPAPQPPPPPAIGYDYVRFYLRTNASAPDGYDANGLLANRLVVVRGRGGNVKDALAYNWTGQAWQRTGTAQVALGAGELEVHAAMPSTTFNATDLVAITADWAGVGDATAPTGVRGTRGTSPGLVPFDGAGTQTIQALPLAATPIVDGSCGTTSNEYSGAASFTNASFHFFVGRRTAIHRIFVCVEVLNDGTNDTGDWGELLFDTTHNHTNNPQPDDRRFRQSSQNGTFLTQKGNGAAWVDCGGTCDAPQAASFFNNSLNQTYEFNISFLDVWLTNDPLPNQRAGFAIVAFEATGADTYWWGSDAVSDTDPFTWGHLDIPEFSDALAVGIATLVCLGFLQRRRRRSSFGVTSR